MKMNKANSCPLCASEGDPFYKEAFLVCRTCAGIFRPREHYPDPDREKARYETHMNNIDDPGYQQFVSPITGAVLKRFTPQHLGLDFGAGTGPVITKILTDHHYRIEPYDPFFHNDPRLLEQPYDYIVCCEVIEHFHDPNREFRLLRRLLKPGGMLYCMTYIYHDGINFDRWFYKNDFTHVFIYQERTLHWIKSSMGFRALAIENGRLASFAL